MRTVTRATTREPASFPAGLRLYPRLVVEVLSRTTQDYDRTDKFDLYRGCATLQDDVLVSTRRQSVHVYSRGADGVWLLRPFGAGDDVLLPSMDFRAPIAAFYEDVELPAGPEIRPLSPHTTMNEGYITPEQAARDYGVVRRRRSLP